MVGRSRSRIRILLNFTVIREDAMNKLPIIYVETPTGVAFLQGATESRLEKGTVIRKATFEKREAEIRQNQMRSVQAVKK